MRKSNSIYLLYMLQILFIGIFIFVLLAYNYKINENDFLANHMYSNNVSGIQLSDHQFPEQVDFEIPCIKSDFMIYKYLAEDSIEIIRGVYGTKDIFQFYKQIETGRFFDINDYEDKSLTVVVGSEILPLTTSENDKKYYIYNQEKYEVIGVFKNTNTDLDNSVYLNLTHLLEVEDNIGLYYVDANRKEVVESVLTQMRQNALGKYRTLDVTYESNLDDGLGSMANTLLIFSAIASILCLCITTIFFIQQQNYSVAIKKMCGMTQKNLFVFYGKRMIALTCISLILLILIMKGITITFNNSFFSLTTLSIEHYILTTLCMIILAFAIAYYVSKSANKVNISITLKGS